MKIRLGQHRGPAILMAALWTLIIALTPQSSAAQGSTLNVSRVTGWEAVGRLNMADRAMCTGALIAPDLVVTAAHCLFDPQTGRPVDASAVTFHAGLAKGRARAQRTVVEATLHPRYRHNHNGPNDANVDLALLRLNAPIPTSSVQPFITDVRPETGAALGVISYTYTRKNEPLLQHPCDVIAKQNDILVMNCEVDFGASGAPVFIVQNGTRPRLVSVISSKAALGNRPVSVGTLLDNALQELLRHAG